MSENKMPKQILPLLTIFIYNAYLLVGILAFDWSIYLLLLAFYFELVFEMMLDVFRAYKLGRGLFKQTLLLLMTGTIYGIFTTTLIFIHTSSSNPESIAHILLFTFAGEYQAQAAEHVANIIIVALLSLLSVIGSVRKSRPLGFEKASPRMLKIHLTLFLGMLFAMFNYTSKALLVTIMLVKIFAEIYAIHYSSKVKKS